MGRVLVATKAIIQKGDTFLAIKQEVLGHNLWDLPGGKIEFEETPEETLRREVKEEVGLEIDRITLIGTYWFFRVTDGDQVVCLVYTCIPREGAIDTTHNPGQDNITEHTYLTASEFMKEGYVVSHPSLKQVVADWNAKRS